MSYKNKYTEEQVVEILKRENFELVKNEIYINTSTLISIKDEEGYLYKLSFSCFCERVIRNPAVLQKFSEKNPYTIENIKTWLNKNTNLTLVSEEYPITRRKNLCFKCSDCLKTFVRRWDVMRNMAHCIYCFQEVPTEDHSFIKKYPDIAKEWDYEKNGNIDVNKVFYASNIKRWWKCEICGNSFEMAVCNRTTRGQGCPYCRMSKKVKLIYNVLKNNGFDFDIEYEFDDLLSAFGNPLRYDFAIFKNHHKKSLVLVEYDDIQHEEFIPYFHRTETMFNEAMRRDELKNMYAKNHNIPLLRITYKDKDVEYVLLSFIQKHIRKNIKKRIML
jgi:hypothetical protein